MNDEELHGGLLRSLGLIDEEGVPTWGAVHAFGVSGGLGSIIGNRVLRRAARNATVRALRESRPQPVRYKRWSEDAASGFGKGKHPDRNVGPTYEQHETIRRGDTNALGTLGPTDALLFGSPYIGAALIKSLEERRRLLHANE